MSAFLNTLMKNNMTILLKKELCFVKQQLPKVAVWGLPLGIGALWFVFPAFTPSFREDIGLPVSKLESADQTAKYKFEYDEMDKMPVSKV